MEWVGMMISVCAAVVTIVWFVRDIRRENSKLLKAVLDIERWQTQILAKMEEGQRRGFETLASIQSKGFETLASIQSKGFEVLEEGLAKMEEGLAKMEEGQRRGFETLAKILVEGRKAYSKRGKKA
jgi:hypothetical protein